MVMVARARVRHAGVKTLRSHLGGDGYRVGALFPSVLTPAQCAPAVGREVMTQRCAGRPAVATRSVRALPAAASTASASSIAVPGRLRPSRSRI